MELKWLEDFIAVAERKHFSQAADARFITQSAISRRIRSLESWLGSTLLNRSHNPIELTPAGSEYLPIAKDLVERTYDGRASINHFSRIDQSGITIGCLHTLTLNYLPDLLTSMHNNVSKFSMQVIAEVRSIEEHVTGLQNQTSDFFICYSHDSVSMNLDAQYFPYLDIAQHWLRPYQGIETGPLDWSPDGQKPIDYLEYSSTTYMTRVISQLLQQAPYRDRLNTIYRASLAESLLAATRAGLGVAWLPETIFKNSAADDGVKIATDKWHIPLNVRVYKLGANNRPLVMEIWDYLKSCQINNETDTRSF